MMFVLFYLLIGIAFWTFKMVLAVALMAYARSRGHAPSSPDQPSVAAHILGILVWPIEAVAMTWRIAAILITACSAWLTARRLRGEP